MLKLWKPAPRTDNHEELFAARYEQLLEWALRLTHNDRQQAEDLVHNAFIEFTLGRADLATIENLDGYLRTVLRNIHLSEIRKATRRPPPLSIVEYDSAEIGLRAIDPRARLRLQDELRAVCQYAYIRKETSKAGSVFILRFFHDYYPSEIVHVLRSTSRAVSEWLRLARAEAKIYLEDPARLHFMRRASESGALRVDASRMPEDLTGELRRAIFRSADVEQCLSASQLSRLYRAAPGSTIEAGVLSHLVSCARCLDTVNQLLGLPSLAERHPTDILQSPSKQGPDRRGGGRSGGGTGTGSTGDADMGRCRRRAREVFEHRPDELFISANGLFLVSQKISAGRCEQTVSVNVDEEIGFIEILSEQGLRLLLLNVEPPPIGPAERFKRVLLSDGRMLEAMLQFSDSHPTLQVVYHDPAYQLRIADCGMTKRSPNRLVRSRRGLSSKSS